MSQGCAHCYAETLNRRMGWAEWGAGGKRKRTSAANWLKPLQWNRAASRRLVRERVFCASLADWLDEEVPTDWRVDLMRLIDATPWLNWLLLTKRIEGWEARMMECAGLSKVAFKWLRGEAPANIWLGTSAENQECWDARVSLLLDVPAAVHFVSAEPLLGPITMADGVRPDWLIVGGESGPGARAVDPRWVRSLEKQCRHDGTYFFFKQWGGVRKKDAGRELDGVVYDEVPDH